MLSLFRRHLDSWVAKVFFALLVGVFVLWGVGDVIRNVGVDTSVATVGGAKIEMPEVQDAYRRQLASVTRMFGGKIDPTPEMRKSIAGQALEQVITHTAMQIAVDKLGIAVPDEALRQAVYAMPAFKGPSGDFDKNAFNAVLRNNNLTEPRFLSMMKADLGQRQLMDQARAGASSPEVLTREVFAFQQEKRVADAVAFPFAAAPPPEAPTEAQLQRWYDNHIDQYSTPERRHIKIAILDPTLVGRDLVAADEDIASAYAQNAAAFRQPERRSLQALLANDEAEARRLAALWSGGADWAAMQKENTSAVDLPNATRDAIPSPELAEAAFSAVPGVVAPPVKGQFGWHVFKVTAITPAVEKTLADVRDLLRTRIVADKAADLVFERSAKIEDMLAGGTPLDELPGDFGLAAASGTLDASGMTADGTPAPIPGADAMRQAIIAAAFAMKKDQPPHLTEAPRGEDGGQGYFAIALDEITPPAPKPFAEVANTVRADWTRDAIRHTQETAAAALLATVKSGKTLADAALGLDVRRLPGAGRASGGEGVPPQLISPLFRLKPGEATMIETVDGFTVAVLAEIVAPDALAAAADYGKTRDQLTEAVAGDIQALLTIALRKRTEPKINTAVFNSIAQSE